MNNYRIQKPSTFVDEIGSQRLTLTKEQLETRDIQTQAQLYQKLCEDHKNHWDKLGKAISNDFSNVKGEPFTLEKHNACVKTVDMDLDILYSEYPKILDVLNTNYNYNVACNEILKYRVNSEEAKIDSVPSSEVSKKQGYISVVIKDNLKDLSKIDKNLTSADIIDGHAILSLNSKGYNLSQNASAYTLNMKQFEGSSGMEEIMGTTSTLDMSGVESNGFPGATHEGHKSYGNYTDSDGNTTLTQLVELVNGQDIHNDINTILDDNASTWYEMELVNVSQDAWNECLGFGFKYSEPNERIVWAQGKKTGEILKLAILIKLDDEIPANHMEIKLHNTKPVSNLTSLFVRPENGSWITVINNSKNVNSGVASETENNTPTKDIASEVEQVAENVRTLIKTNVAQAIALMTQYNNKKTGKEIGISGNGASANVIVTDLGNRSHLHYYAGGNTTVVTAPENTSSGYMEELITTGMHIESTTDTLSINQTVSADKDIHNILFENKFLKEILIVLTQTVSYDCNMIHRYYKQVTTTKTTTTEVDAGGICGGSEQSTHSEYNTTSNRIDGENAPAEVMFSGVGGTASSGGNIGETIGTVLTGIGMLIGGPAAPVLAGIGMVAGLFGAGDSTSTSTDVVSDQVITGLELLPGWRYAVGIKDVNIYGNNYSASSDVVSSVYTLPRGIKSISISASEMIPRSYPTGIYLKYYVSLDRGTTWLSINPKNFPLRDTSIPRKYIVNPDSDYSAKTTEASLTLENLPRTVQFKCTISRPDSYPYNLYTPSLESYSIFVECEQ